MFSFKSFFSPEKAVEYERKLWKSLPPIYPRQEAPKVREKMHEFFMAAILGGMSYEDAKSASEKYYSVELEKAEKLDAELLAVHKEACAKWLKENNQSSVSRPYQDG